MTTNLFPVWINLKSVRVETKEKGSKSETMEVQFGLPVASILITLLNIPPKNENSNKKAKKFKKCLTNDKLVIYYSVVSWKTKSGG